MCLKFCQRMVEVFLLAAGLWACCLLCSVFPPLTRFDSVLFDAVFHAVRVPLQGGVVGSTFFGSVRFGSVWFGSVRIPPPRARARSPYSFPFFLMCV